MYFQIALYWVACFVLGSVPFGLLIGRWWARVDVRDSGSGNIGTTNVLRTIGPLPAAVVLVLDAAKGWLPVIAASGFGFSHPVVAVAALAAVAGHSWSVFLNFKGGRGVATAFGVLIGLSPVSALVLVLVFALIVGFSRYVSLGSIVASALLPVALAVFHAPAAYIVLGAILGVVSVLRHMPNIRRLLAGTENRFGRPNPQQQKDTDMNK